MQSQAWIDLLKRIPLEHHNSLMLMTTIGMELTLQAILHVDADYVVVRARPAGTTDTGRAFFVPYDQINYLGYQREVKEAEIRTLYGQPTPIPAQVQPPPEAAPAPLAEIVPPPMPAAAVEPAHPRAPAPSRARIPIPGKEAILERLRRRAAVGSGPSTPPQP